MAATTNWTEIAAIGTLIQCLVILVAAAVAGSQLRESRNLRHSQTRPYVVVSVVASPVERTLVDLVIENIGSTPALNVTFQVTPELTSSLDKRDDRVSEWNVLRKGISHLAPNQKVSTLFDSLLSRNSEESPYPRVYVFDVRYSGVGERTSYSESIEIDLGVLIGSRYVVEKGIHDIAKSADEIHRVIKGWTEGSSALRVLTGDLDAFHQHQRDEWNRRIADNQSLDEQPDSTSSTE